MLLSTSYKEHKLHNKGEINSHGRESINEAYTLILVSIIIFRRQQQLSILASTILQFHKKECIARQNCTVTWFIPEEMLSYTTKHIFKSICPSKSALTPSKYFTGHIIMQANELVC